MSIAVGQRASRSLTLTAEHVRKFAEISGDHNPLHFDAAFAARTKFGRLVVQGGLTTGLLHALVATDMPGPFETGAELRVQIRRSDDTIVLDGEAWCYTFSDSSA